jgi:hypothetical protein
MWNPSWCLVTTTMYFAPASWAMRTHSLALKCWSVNCLYRLSYTSSGIDPCPPSGGRRVYRLQPSSVPRRLDRPKWMNMPRRASVHHCAAPGCPKELASHRSGVNDWNEWTGTSSGVSGPRTGICLPSFGSFRCAGGARRDAA